MDPSKFNLRHLSALLEVNKLGSISQAAPIVHLSQSAITQGIAKLEKSLHCKLFERTSTGLRPDDRGSLFIARVERAWHHLNGFAVFFNRKSQPQTQGKLLHSLTSTQLRALVTVVEQKNYTLAAKKLGLTQPTLHRAIRELEFHCGRQLLHRSPSGVEPNWLARQAALKASLYFSELNQGIDELDEFSGDLKGQLHIGSLPLALTSIVPNDVAKLLLLYPKAQIHIVDGSYEDLLSALLHGKLDVIVGALREPAPSPDIKQEFLFDDSLHIVVRSDHPLSKRKAASLSELQALKWIAPRRDAPARQIFSNIFLKQGLEPPSDVIECGALVAIRGLLLASDRAALLSSRQVAVEVEQNILAISPQELAGTNRKIGLTFRKDWEPTKLQRAFVSLVKNPN